MRSLKQIILVSAMAIALATGVTAQNDDQKRPPKNPPVRDPGVKPPKEKPPKGDDKPKKPGMSFYLVSAVRDNNNA